MGGALLAVEHPVDHATLDRYAPAYRGGRLGQQSLGDAGRLARERDQLDAGVVALRFVQHRAISKPGHRQTTRAVHKCNARRAYLDACRLFVQPRDTF